MSKTEGDLNRRVFGKEFDNGRQSFQTTRGGFDEYGPIESHATFGYTFDHRVFVQRCAWSYQIHVGFSYRLKEYGIASPIIKPKDSKMMMGWYDSQHCLEEAKENDGLGPETEQATTQSKEIEIMGFNYDETTSG